MMREYILLLCLLLCVSCSEALFNRKTASASTKSISTQSKSKNIKIQEHDEQNEEKEDVEEPRTLLPQLTPHPDDCYLLEFVTDDNDHCIQMEPVVQRLEKDLSTKVRRINIGRRADLTMLFDTVGGNECGNVPYFYNRRTAQAICGATPYRNLRKLGCSDPDHLFINQPLNSLENKEFNPRRQRGIGFMDQLSEKFLRTTVGQSSKKKTKKTSK